MDMFLDLQNFVVEELLNGTSVESNDNLLEDGMVDSIGLVRLIAYIEETYQLIIPPEDFTIENFQTIAALTNYLNNLGNSHL